MARNISQNPPSGQSRRGSRKGSVTPTVRPPEMVKPKPRTICIVASVAISALMRNREIATPLQSPTTPPIDTPANMPNRTLPTALVTTAATTSEQATTEPTDKSKFPDAKQNSIVHPTMPICDTANAKPFTFTHYKQCGEDHQHTGFSPEKHHRAVGGC